MKLSKATREMLSQIYAVYVMGCKRRNKEPLGFFKWMKFNNFDLLRHL